MSLEISIADQKLFVYRGDELIKEFVVSTAANGMGFDEGSYCTPMGRFEICEKIGQGAALGTIFKSRLPEGFWDGSPSEQDLVLTRILWLNGLDPENANTKDRYIYIHGTNQEEVLGCPASWGCVRMGNDDVIDLFDRVEVGERVLIG